MSEEFMEIGKVYPGTAKTSALSQWCCNALMEKAGELELADGEVCLPGCCGGGCYVLVGMKFCPFCGLPLHPSG